MSMPPASFEMLVLSLKFQAEQGLGLLRVDANTPVETDLALARHAIDLLAMLQEKTRGNLSLEESRLLENSLTELRFRFVQTSSEMAKPKTQEAAAGQ
jgi:hypothetical protein